jgi:23S rRNA (uracil1939-C5)-methyltransferase
MLLETTRVITVAKRRHFRQHAKTDFAQAKKIDFQIENIDGLGQGVSKLNDEVHFIAKTLPGETGTARVLKQKKSVGIAMLDKLDIVSDQRIESSCPHFQHCPGCHFLHTDYATELALKKSALQNCFRKVEMPQSGIDVSQAPQRQHYRNRLQLHYRHKYLGMVDGLKDQVVEIPKCQILMPQLQAQLQALYDDKSWSKDHSGNGHCEIYWQDDRVNVSWDKPYADGGFTQVNQAVNTMLIDEVRNRALAVPFEHVLDLFSGCGNLSSPIIAEQSVPRRMVDVSDTSHADFMAMNLYDKDALPRFLQRQRLKQFDLMLVDPPRKGFPALNDWVNKLKPKRLIYVSCNPASLAADVQSLTGKFKLSHLSLLDMFPSTYHFETVATLDFKKH